MPRPLDEMLTPEEMHALVRHAKLLASKEVDNAFAQEEQAEREEREKENNEAAVEFEQEEKLVEEADRNIMQSK